MQAGPETDRSNLYAAPKAVDPPAAPENHVTVAARLAGALLAFVAVTNLIGGVLSLLEVRQRLSAVGSRPLLAATFIPVLVSTAITVLLAIPLLRGRRRFRVLALMRAGLPPAVALVGRVVMAGRASIMMGRRWNLNFAFNCLLFGALLVLLVGRPGAGRKITGGALGALYISIWIAGELGVLAF